MKKLKLLIEKFSYLVGSRNNFVDIMVMLAIADNVLGAVLKSYSLFLTGFMCLGVAIVYLLKEIKEKIGKVDIESIVIQIENAQLKAKNIGITENKNED